MLAILHLLGTFVVNLFRSRRRLEVENLFLRHQLNIALRSAPHRLRLHASDRALKVWMTRVWPSLLGLSCVVQPDTILRWHRAGFRAYWRWKSRGQLGRPKLKPELRELIRRMSKENLLWGAPRIHGELLKLGFEIAESTVSKYMIRHRGPPSQNWRLSHRLSRSETPVASWCSMVQRGVPWCNGATARRRLRVLRVTCNAGDVRCRP